MGLVCLCGFFIKFYCWDYISFTDSVSAVLFVILSVAQCSFIKSTDQSHYCPNSQILAFQNLVVFC